MMVVAPKVGRALDGLSYVLIENCMALQGGNPAIYLNSLPVQKRVVGWVNNARIGVVDAVQGNSVAVNNRQMDDVPLLYGVLLHESAHAWARKTRFPEHGKECLPVRNPLGLRLGRRSAPSVRGNDARRS